MKEGENIVRMSSSFTEALDYISRRVTISGGTGALAGSFIALYRGHDSVFRTAARTAFSCALVGTACFSAERLVYLGVRHYLLVNDDDAVVISNESRQKEDYYLKLYSHALGGLLSGAWLGRLYTGKAVRGALFFAPLMLGIAVAEEMVNESFRELRQQHIASQSQSREIFENYGPQEEDMNKRN